MISNSIIPWIFIKGVIYHGIVWILYHVQVLLSLLKLRVILNRLLFLINSKITFININPLVFYYIQNTNNIMAFSQQEIAIIGNKLILFRFLYTELFYNRGSVLFFIFTNFIKGDLLVSCYYKKSIDINPSQIEHMGVSLYLKLSI